MRSFFSYLTFAVLCLFSQLGHSESTTSDVFNLTSEYTHRTYQIQVYLPNVPAPKDGFRTLYVLDGNSIFDTAKNISNLITTPLRPSATLQPVAIVAIGYPHIGQAFNTQARALDYTPPLTQATAQQSANRFGESAQFINFLSHELQPTILKKYPINPNAQSIYGHSLGGLLVLELFFKQPSLFNRYIAASPSIWFNQFEILQQQQKWLAEKTRPMLMISFGSNEDAGPSQLKAEDAKQQRSFFLQQFKHQDHVWSFIQPAEQHMSNLFATLPKAVMFAGCVDASACNTLMTPTP